jgi:hypothetical protein
MGFKLFGKKTPAERAKDHIRDVVRHHVMSSRRRRPAQDTGPTREQILREIEQEERLARASAKEGGVKGWEIHMRRARELRRLLG